MRRSVKWSLLALALALVLGAVALVVVPRVHAQMGAPGRPPRAFAGTGGQIGVSIRDVKADELKGLKLASQAGAIVDEVRPGSPASTAGLHNGDVIVEFDGEKVRSARQLTRLVLETPAGREVKVAFMRDGHRTEASVTPAEAPFAFGFPNDEARRALENVGRAGRDMVQNFRLPRDRQMPERQGRLGVNVQELSPELASYFGVKDGVLVASVGNDSPASKAGLKAGDVITSVDGQAVGSTAELIGAMNTKSAGQELTLTVVRDKKELSLKAKLETPNTPPRAAERVRA